MVALNLAILNLWLQCKEEYFKQPGQIHTFAAGPLAIADDLQVFEVTKDSVVQKTLYVADRAPGYIFPKNASITVPVGYELIDINTDYLPRTATVNSLGTVLKVFGHSAGRATGVRGFAGWDCLVSVGTGQEHFIGGTWLSSIQK